MISGCTSLVGGPVQVLGASELEPTSDGLLPHRLPAAARAQLPDDFARMCEEQPSGVRLVFRTAAWHLELDVRAICTAMARRPLAPAGLYDVVVDGQCVAQGSAPGYGVLELDPLDRTTTVHHMDSPPRHLGQRVGVVCRLVDHRPSVG